MADFHFLFMSWSFALEWSLQCLLFRLLQRGFIHLLDVWNSWKVLVKNWLWVVIHNNITVEQNKRLLSAWNFPGYCLALSCGVMLRGLSIGFTFNTNLSIFKVKTRERKLFCCRINRSRALFFFSNHGSCYIKNWAQSPMASRVERLNALLICDICECFCNETVAICCENVLYLREKNLHATLKVWKNIAC